MKLIKPFLKWLKDKPTYNWGEIEDKVYKLISKIKSLINDGDRCLILSENRPYWLMTDIAIMFISQLTLLMIKIYIKRL